MNKNSKVLALKYRPQTFEDLIGQRTTSETIINSIRNNKTPNAYLFTGIRGVGKTTLARIVAKALNCKKSIENISQQNSCENCDCEAIANSNHIDVLEMDAASKTGVDDVRDLIEFSRYGPTSAKYKIFIIDEVHMLSKQAFNALLKTLEEPPEYLKFIFATTEIKKIPITVVSRCQRFDLSRIKSSELFDFLKKVSLKENARISDNVLKLIIKISEGSVRDALSLLDRGMLSTSDKDELSLEKAQQIFGFFDKSKLIELFIFILEGNETKTLELYRKIYDQGVDPRVFINDFLELLYYFKNINFLSVENSNFSLNDDEHKQIKKLSESIDNKNLMLFWQFTIKTLNELDIVSNQNLSIEMFLLRLIYLSGMKVKNEKSTIIDDKQNKQQKISSEIINSNNKDVIDQIKNISQEKKIKPETKLETKSTNKTLINSFNELLNICLLKREIKLKYDLEKNVNLVKFEKGRIEISFNDNLDKDFVKDLSTKLFEWTNERWIISFSKNKGEMSVKDKEKNNRVELIENSKKTDLYKTVVNFFPDAELIDVNTVQKDDSEND